MFPSLHPLCIIARTDAEITTLYHSFFLLEFNQNQPINTSVSTSSAAGANENDFGLKTIIRIPAQRDKIDTIESGLKLFLISGIKKSLDVTKNISNTFQPLSGLGTQTNASNISSNNINFQSPTLIETGGTFVVTTSDGLRFNAFYRMYDGRIFLAVTPLSIFSFTRKVFDYLGYEINENINVILSTLCECPIFPAPGLVYNVEFTHGSASIDFSSIAQVEDVDLDLIIFSIMSPIMIVKAWESIILERKVLVVSNVESIITPCCEYIRRLILPLVMVNTFVPLLPIELINAVEAPFPYLLGAKTDTLRACNVDLSDTVVIDLDTRLVIPPRNSAANPINSFASSKLLARLLNEVNNIMLNPIGNWYNRPATSSMVWEGDKQQSYSNPISENSLKLRSTKILEIFISTNLSLISARNCSVRAFYRRPEYNSSINNSFAERGGNKKVLTTMGFDCKLGVFSGFMQYTSKDVISDDDQNIQHLTPCWIEMDDCIFSVYEYADDLPLLFFPVIEMETVSPSPIEPEGHVFEIVLKDQSMYRFTSTDALSRRKWITSIEEVRKKAIKKENINNQTDPSPGSPSPQHNNNGGGNSSLFWEGGSVNSPQLTADEAGYVNAQINDYVFPQLGLPQYVSDVMSQSILSIGEGSSAESSVDHAHQQLTSAVQNVNPSVTSFEEDALFRFYFSKTQMMSSLFSNIECIEYENILKELDIKSSDLVSKHFDDDMTKYMCTTGTVIGTIDRMNRKEMLSSLTAESNDSRDGITKVSDTISINRIASDSQVLDQSIRLEFSSNGSAVNNTSPTPVSDKNRKGTSVFSGFFRSSSTKSD
eukprot:gene6959-9514_t